MERWRSPPQAPVRVQLQPHGAWHKIEIREFQGTEDLELQYSFWNEVTAQLPHAWKATRSPSHYNTLEEFDPRSKAFAFDEGKCVGYMSFSGQGTFVSPGYPWHLEGYEHIRDQLWDRVFGYASGEHGGNQFLQRFRASWTQQIDYFLSKGFEIVSKNPMLMVDPSERISLPDHNYIVTTDPFDTDIYFSTILTNTNFHESQLDDLREYYGVVEFDTSVQIGDQSGVRAVVATSDRTDTGFSDILALTYPKDDPELLRIMITSLLAQLKDQRVVNITLGSDASEIPVLRELGFETRDHEIYVSLNL